MAEVSIFEEAQRPLKVANWQVGTWEDLGQPAIVEMTAVAESGR